MMCGGSEAGEAVKGGGAQIETKRADLLKGLEAVLSMVSCTG
jgi:hypothetical protein